jgi:predicted aspartyl protease
VILGVVNARIEAIVCLRVRGPGGFHLDVDAVVDSGFTASLTLPMTTVVALGLVRQSSGGAVLADGAVLLGMRLLAGHELRMAVVPGGAVEITPLP